jgi:thiazole-adenylate synthase
MSLESIITHLILEETFKDLLLHVDCDVVIVGAGPSGLTAAKYLADRGLKTIVLERRLSYGGGIGGGGNLLHKVVLDSKANHIIRDFKIKAKETSVKDFYVVDAAELMSKLAVGALEAGAKIILGVDVEDLIVRENPFRVAGVVFKWSAISIAGLHVDPLFMSSKATVDATGHDAVLVNTLVKKNKNLKLEVIGEKSAYSEKAERDVVEYTGLVVPGLYVTGMAVATLHGLHRMGPIFTGMLLSGKKVAEIIAEDLGA